MDIILCLIGVICLWKMKFTAKWNEDYMSKEKTTAVNGIFVMLVFLRHITSYVQYGKYSEIFSYMNIRLGQFIVVSFLFYSGYGCMTAVINKGSSYIESMPKKRIFRVWYHFAIAVMLFMITNLIMNIKYDYKTVILAFTGLESIGNSSWYIIAILVMYIATYGTFKLLKTESNLKKIIVVAVLCGIYICIFWKIKNDNPWYYNTVAAYPLGMFYAQYKNKIEAIVWKNNYVYLALSGIFLCIFIFGYHYGNNLVVYQLLSMVFVLLLVLLTMKITFKNEILEFLGKYTFDIYILQRIPMIIFKDVVSNEYIYFSVCLILTIIIAVLFRKITNRLDAMIIK